MAVCRHLGAATVDPLDIMTFNIVGEAPTVGGCFLSPFFCKQALNNEWMFVEMKRILS